MAASFVSKKTPKKWYTEEIERIYEDFDDEVKELNRFVGLLVSDINLKRKQISDIKALKRTSATLSRQLESVQAQRASVLEIHRATKAKLEALRIQVAASSRYRDEFQAQEADCKRNAGLLEVEKKRFSDCEGKEGY